MIHRQMLAFGDLNRDLPLSTGVQVYHEIYRMLRWHIVRMMKNDSKTNERIS